MKIYKKFILIIGMLFILASCIQEGGFSIIFNSNGGNVLESLTYDGSSLVLPDNPTKTGYDFDGWYLDDVTFLVPFSIQSILDEPLQNDLTVFAKWSINQYTISFDSNGGTSLASITQDYLTSVTEPDDPTRDGYIFVGWYTDAFLTSAYTISTMPAEDLTLYAKWANDPEVTYTIIWQNEDGTVLETDEVEAGTVPTYDGSTPVKDSTETYTYTFTGFTPTISFVTGDQVYVATYEENLIEEQTEFDPDLLNDLFGFDIYSTIPSFSTSDYYFGNYSDPTFFDIFVDMFDWTETDFNNYIDLLDSSLSYDSLEESWILGDYYLYVYADNYTYERLIVYGFGIYGDNANGTGETGESFDSNDLNTIFGFDIYSLMPAFTSNDALLLDYSDSTIYEVYIDIFDWSEADGLAYIDLLDALLAYDEVEASWILGDYYIYVYADDESYDGLIVYGIGIYGDVTSTPLDNLYYVFDVQSTTTTLTTSYKDNVDQSLIFSGSSGKVVVQSSYLAQITGTPPSGLTNGVIFAANVADIANPLVYLEIDTLGQTIETMSFQIEARDSFSTNLLGAVLQVYNGSAWVNLEGGDFYSQLSSDQVLITINHINASQFRLLFTGSGITSNGGQFKISTVSLYTSSSVIIESWDEAVLMLEGYLSETALSELFPQFENLTDIELNRISNSHYAIIAGLVTASNTQTIDQYIADLIVGGFALDSELSTTYGENVYTLVISDDIAYAVYVTYDETSLEMHIWKYDPLVEIGLLDTLVTRQTINEFEVEEFSQSGLPSVGTYDVLVIPVEISGYPFASDYLTNLDLVFNGNSATTGWESVSSYYEKSSYGLLDLTFVISNKYTTTNTKEYYQNYGTDGDQYAITEALTALDFQIDFSHYDSNNDGLIDSIIFIYSVDYNYDSDPWWAWVYAAQYGEASSIGSLDGKAFEYYMWASYTFSEDALPGMSGLVVNAETYIHEMGHLMGFPDLYSYDRDYGPIGGFDMMDYNVGDHGPFNKLMFGWLHPLLATTGSYEVTIDSYSIDTDGVSSAILIPYNANDLNDGNAFDEYLLIIFYTPEGLYSAHMNTGYELDQAGVVIYHIDARMNPSAGFWDNYFSYNNDGSSLFIAEILEADFNNSIPGSTQTIEMSDILTSGSIDLSSYTWHQGGSIDVSIEISSLFTNTSDSISFILTVS
ncbi:MAG: InlB B-repeat-containing protein [Firmicutes bacterium]|nr:InlB B-repeat-containing protein [Bacillota bacterium]